jgi:hypothetical protein
MEASCGPPSLILTMPQSQPAGALYGKGLDPGTHQDSLGSAIRFRPDADDPCVMTLRLVSQGLDDVVDGLHMISLNRAFRSRGGRFSCSSARYNASFG